MARVELSNATLANWVAKTAGYLSEEFDIGAGSVVGLHLPLHWQLHVWAYGAWAWARPWRASAPRTTSPRPAPLLAVGTDPMGLPLGSATPKVRSTPWQTCAATRTSSIARRWRQMPL